MSWPATRKYSRDVESVELAEATLNTVLDDIAALQFEDVYILAHSLGNRLVMRVLADRQRSGADLTTVRTLS